MPSMDRRKFLGVVGAGSAVASAAAASAAGLSAAATAPAASSAGTGLGLHFRAETALPAKPWPAYATAVAEGSVDLASGTGFVATRVLAGPPGSQGDVGLPGTARLVRITAARTSGSLVYLLGVVEDRSTLAEGESASKNFVLDQVGKQLYTVIAGTEMSLALSTG